MTAKRKFALPITVVSALLLLTLIGFVQKGRAEAQAFKTGQKLPDIVLKNQEGKSFHLKRALGKGPIVLAFFPAAFSPVCTKQLCDYRDHLPNLKKLKADVYGISGDSVETLKKFHKENKFPFPLLSDPKGEVSKKFDAWYSAVGKSKRSIVIIDSKGVLRFNEAESLPINFKDTRKLVELVQKNSR